MHCVAHISTMPVAAHSDRERTAAAASAASNRHAPCTSTHPRHSLLPLALLVTLLCTLLGRVQLHAAADPTLLSSLSSSLTETHNAPLVPAFSPAETSYAQNVPNGAQEVVFRAVAEEPANSQLWAKWNAGEEFQVQSGVDTAPLRLGQLRRAQSEQETRAGEQSRAWMLTNVIPYVVHCCALRRVVSRHTADQRAAADRAQRGR